MNALLIVLYIVFAVGGSTLIKYAGINKLPILFSLPLVNMTISWATIAGVLFYGLSFMLYILLLTRFDLSFISPVTIGAVYILLMVTAAFVFSEQFTLMKVFGCTLILIGIILVVLGK